MSMKRNSIKVFAPATVGNIGCGFDIMGLAVNQPGDEVQLTKNDSGKLIIKKITGDDGKLSLNAKKNTVSVSIHAFLKEHGIKQGFDIILNKKMPLGSGLGSSAASAVAGVYAANILLGNHFKKEDLLPFAMEGERIACGSAHADNVAPCLLGGIVLIRSNEPLDIISLPVPAQLYVTVIHPHIEVLTKDSRAILKNKIPLKDGVQQWANAAAFVAGLYQEDYQLIGRSVEDLVAEPYRAHLIPDFYKVKKAAVDNGALACSISGSGPSVFALSKGKAKCSQIASAMSKAFASAGIKSDSFISSVNNSGVKII